MIDKWGILMMVLVVLLLSWCIHAAEVSLLVAMEGKLQNQQSGCMTRPNLGFSCLFQYDD